MEINRIWAIYFSPTGGTKKAVLDIAEKLGGHLGKPVEELDFTKLENRQKTYSFAADDLVVVGSPVYAGRVPNKIMPDFEKCFQGNGAKAIPVSVYGNRSFGDALMELKGILEEEAFTVIGGVAIVSSHAFSNTLAAGRPSQQDFDEISSFVKTVALTLVENREEFEVNVQGNNPVGPYYTPLQEDMTPAKFLKAKPLTDLEKCSHCGICAEVCPMGSIDAVDYSVVKGVCIKCQACVKKCNAGAKYFDDEQFLSHVRMLEKNYGKRADNYFFTPENR